MPTTYMKNLFRKIKKKDPETGQEYTAETTGPFILSVATDVEFELRVIDE